MRPRGRAAQRLLCHDPAARAKQTRDPAEGPYRVGLVHQEKPGIRQVERAAHDCRVEFVEVTGKQLHVAQLKRRHDRPGPLDGRPAPPQKEHRPHRAQQAIILIPARQSATRRDVSRHHTLALAAMARCAGLRQCHQRRLAAGGTSGSMPSALKRAARSSTHCGGVR